MTLSDLNRVDFFGPKIAAESARLATTISRLMGETAPEPTTMSMAVAEATAGQRVDLLRRTTNETVLDPAKRIQLDDLIAAELGRVLHVMRDETLFPVNVDGQRLLDHWAQAAKSAQDYAALLQPLAASLQVAARWADPTRLTPWVTAIRTLAAEAETVRGGSTVLLPLRRLPVVLLVLTAAVAALGDKRWDNLKAVAMDVTVPYGQSQTSRPVLDLFYPWRAFDSNEDLANVIARVGVGGLSPEEAATAVLEKVVGRYRAPIPDWLYVTLRPLFTDQFPDETLYAQAFDRAETVLGVLSQDLAEEDKRAHPDQPHWAHPGSSWFGRATYTSVWSSSPVDDLAAEAAAAGPAWEPLRLGLFGGDPTRARDSIGAYRADFEDLRRRRT